MPNTPKQRRPLTVRRMMRHVFIAGLALGLMAGLARNRVNAPEAARRAQCVNCLKQIAIALHNYAEDWNGHLPPAVTLGPDGKPRHSWRVLLLPYLEEKAIYAGYSFDEPWDGPKNRKFHSIRVPFYSCPSHQDYYAKRLCCYVAVTGPGTAFPGPNQSARLSDIRDGTDATIVVVESANRGPHWMEPRDLELRGVSWRINDPARPSISSYHDDSVNVAFADGHVSQLRHNATPQKLRALLTIAGGEVVDDDR